MRLTGEDGRPRDKRVTRERRVPENYTPRDVQQWLIDAVADAERRGLPELRPLLENLAQSTALLRAADWNDDAGPRPGTRVPDPITILKRENGA